MEVFNVFLNKFVRKYFEFFNINEDIVVYIGKILVFNIYL